VLPVVIAYTIAVYRIFHGKVRKACGRTPA
jgi:cytochrome bd-type quinol oxidase subunit 2